VLDAILFYAFGALILAAAVLTVTVKNIFHAALYLAVSLLAVAAMYITLGAYFLAMLQIMVYIGAVVVLAIFVINLTRNITGAPVTLSRRWVIPAALVSALTACLIAIALLKRPASGAPPPLEPGSTATLGRHLLGDYLLPFELVTVLLLAALIAAVAIVNKDSEEEE
jgi:NADH-quinone oxidoreductase subunit J